MSAIIDLRSDTVTKPTAAMRSAMREAEVGDDGRLGPDGVYGDPTVNALQARAAGLLGKDDALFMPSGSMANLVAVLTHCVRGDAAIVGATAHIYRAEKAAFMDELFGIRALMAEEKAGVPVLAAVEKLLATEKPRLLCLENTHNTAGGTAMSIHQTVALAKSAHDYGAAVHLDGARIFNAATALGVTARALAAPVDSVQFCLSKGLGAPIGSLLAGPSAFIRRAREWRKLLGGQMRQAGMVAAAGLVALDTMVARLGDDHKAARSLAEKLAGTPELKVDLASVQSNIVKVDVTGTNRTAQEFQRDIAPHGVWVHIATPTEIRLVTHADVGLGEVMRAADIIIAFASSCVAAKRP
jgi:threonine aldolase